MVVTHRPKPQAAIDEAAALRIIEKGGTAPAASESPQKAIHQHPLKMPHDLLERIETARSKAAVKLPRNTWILQAIAERLEREGA